MYELFFERATHRGTGFAFPCTADGKVNVSELHPHAAANYHNCVDNRWKEYLPPVIRETQPQ